VILRRAKPTSKHPPLVQRSACRTTPAPAVQRAAQTSHAFDWAQIEAALSRQFGRPIQLSDPEETNRPAQEPGQSLGGLADSDQDELWYPPVRTPIFCADADLRPCDREHTYLWTFAGSPTWFKAEVYPPPR